MLSLAQRVAQNRSDIGTVEQEIKDAEEKRLDFSAKGNVAVVDFLTNKINHLQSREQHLRVTRGKLEDETLLEARRDKRPREEDINVEEGPSKMQTPTSDQVVAKLVAMFGEDLRRVHKEDPPGALRKGDLQDQCRLGECIEMVGRKETFDQWVYWTALVFKRWYYRGPTDVNNYRRGLAQILLLSFPGAGKTTFLEMLLTQLREWLEEHGDAECLAILQRFMFSRAKLTEGDKKVASVLLEALHSLAGTATSPDERCHLFLMLRVLDRAKPLDDLETSSETGAALRILAAALTPLHPRPPRDGEPPTLAGFNYERLFERIDQPTRRKMNVNHVLTAIRTALGLPPGKEILILLLIDEVNAACGTFLDKDARRDADASKLNWVLQLLSKAIFESGMIDSSTPPTLLLPVSTSTLYEAVDMTYAKQYTWTGTSLAVQLGLPVLTIEHMERILLTLCSRVATKHGRQPPNKLPEAVLDCLHMLGGSPRLTTLLAEAIAAYDKFNAKGHAFEWMDDFDLQVGKVEGGMVKTLLDRVKQAGALAYHWQSILNPSKDPPLKVAAMRRVVALVLTDGSVKRSDLLVPSNPSSPTVGCWEAGGLLHCSIQGRDVVDATAVEASSSTSVASSSNTPQTLQATLRSGTSSPATAGVSSSSLASANQITSPSPVRRKVGNDVQLVTKSPATGQWLKDESSGPKVSPSKAALVDERMSCAQPSNVPSAEPVHVSISPLVLQYMLEQLSLSQPEDLTVFSAHVDRESAQDKEFVDAGMLALKLLGFHILGHDKVTLQELLPGIPIPAVAKGVKFLVPHGHNIRAAPGGRRQDKWLTPSEVETKIEECRNSIIRSRTTAAGARGGQEDIIIGFVGVGNKGMDSMVVLVDEHGQAWALVVQSKQVQSRRVKHETVRRVLANMQTDLCKTFHLPVLPRSWKTWHSQKKAKAPPQAPCTQLSSQQQQQASIQATTSGLLPFDRVLYVYVTDGSFSGPQNGIFGQVLERDHPWLKRVMLISSHDSQSYYSRVGALKRDVMRRAVTSRLASSP